MPRPREKMTYPERPHLFSKLNRGHHDSNSGREAGHWSCLLYLKHHKSPDHITLTLSLLPPLYSPLSPPSPPIWVCWRILPHCVSETPVGCSLTILYGNKLHLNHTFTSTGVHCLDINVRNDISKLQTSYSLFVRKKRE